MRGKESDLLLDFSPPQYRQGSSIYVVNFSSKVQQEGIRHWCYQQVVDCLSQQSDEDCLSRARRHISNGIRHALRFALNTDRPYKVAQNNKPQTYVYIFAKLTDIQVSSFC